MSNQLFEIEACFDLSAIEDQGFFPEEELEDSTAESYQEAITETLETARFDFKCLLLDLLRNYVHSPESIEGLDRIIEITNCTMRMLKPRLKIPHPVTKELRNFTLRITDDGLKIKFVNSD